MSVLNFTRIWTYAFLNARDDKRHKITKMICIFGRTIGVMDDHDFIFGSMVMMFIPFRMCITSYEVPARNGKQVLRIFLLDVEQKPD